MLELSYLNQMLHVVVDRPLGSYHPEYKYRYPINYGYIPDTLAPDGEETDAYIIGIDYPVDHFYGKCIAIIERLNDVENKLVVAPPGFCFDMNLIQCSVSFQEQFFKTNIIM